MSAYKLFILLKFRFKQVMDKMVEMVDRVMALMAAIEGTEDAFATASGMAAVNGALSSMLKAGDHVVAARALFGSCLYVLEILGRFGVEVTLVDGTDLGQWQAAVRDGTKAVFLESVSNPTLEVIDVKSVAVIAHAKGATVIVDNVFATPTFSKAVALGADVVVYSATKHIDGSGRCLGGIGVGSGRLDQQRGAVVAQFIDAVLDVAQGAVVARLGR